jgi:hypothetical protein
VLGGPKENGFDTALDESCAGDGFGAAVDASCCAVDWEEPPN